LLVFQEDAMAVDDRDLLDVLKFELNFLKKGGYGRSPREAWRAALVFEDSPACMNYDMKDHPSPCKECVLIDLVPINDRKQAIPCRHIQLTQAGDTLETLYRWGSQAEIEEVYGKWLRQMIHRLEDERERLAGRAVIAASPAVTE
jgi:hypothetical protein